MSVEDQDSFDRRFLTNEGDEEGGDSGNNNLEAIRDMFCLFEEKVNNRMDEMQARFAAIEGVEQADPKANEVNEADVDITQLQAELSAEASTASKASDAEPQATGDDDLLKELIKQAEASTLMDVDVDPRVASIVNALFRKKMNSEQFRQMTSDMLSARPNNCEGLATVQTNTLLWAQFSDKTRLLDKKLQNQQKALVGAGSIITKMFDKLVAAKGNTANLQIPDLMNSVNKSLMLLGDVNFNLNMFRRNLMRPELKDTYRKLCAETVPFTSELFGEDLAKLAKEIGETAKMSNQMKSNRPYSAVRAKGADFKKRYEPYHNPRYQQRKGDNPRSSFSGNSYQKKNFPKRSNDKTKP